MRNRTATLLTDQPDQGLLHQLYFLQQVCLALAAQAGVLALSVRFFEPLARVIPSGLTNMSPLLSMAALFSALSLFLSESGRSPQVLYVSQLFAIFTALIPAALLLAPTLHNPFGLESLLNSGQPPSHYGSTALRPAMAFVLLAIVMFLVRAAKPVASQLADVAVALLSLVVLILVYEYLFGILQILGPSVSGFTSPLTLMCLMSLTVVAVFRRAECGVFSIFLGHGIGSRIARILSPILLVLPFLREVWRARLINSQTIPVHYATAILTSTATVISFALLLYLAGRINRMEMEIHALTLRDELTGLYNLRGFQLLANQSLRFAQRAHTAFSLLFIDLDNLKKINDAMGHEVGSAFLVETGELLNSIFREMDVIGRIGGDEFVVAGQFTEDEISAIARGLEEASMLRNSKTAHQFPLSFSMGHVTTDGSLRESLKHLLGKADKAMYQQKRRKKRETL